MQELRLLEKFFYAELTLILRFWNKFLVQKNTRRCIPRVFDFSWNEIRNLFQRFEF